MINGSSLNGWPQQPSGPTGQELGHVVGGSLGQGVEVRLDSEGLVSVEDVKVGSFITIQGTGTVSSEW